MAGAETKYYWDTCIFLAWIKDEQRPSGEIDGVREVVARAKRREVIIMTSVLTLTEALQSKLPVGMDRLFADLLKRTERIGMDIKVARLATISATTTWFVRINSTGKCFRYPTRYTWPRPSFIEPMSSTRLTTVRRILSRWDLSAYRAT